ncbi:helix-turn-helix domain-containing protein [Fournierella massiliensis]|uniref:helix-turn-helix domain-containing protein n=1 Tax=Allofournierella massiliensis TaxID=1650663 RepID=UPI003521BE88
MANPYQGIGEYLYFIRRKYNVQICVKDFGGFVHINRELHEVLSPFLAHLNPFCLYMKSEQQQFHVCLSMIRKMHDRFQKKPEAFFGICHAGLGEYVVPVWRGDLLLGTVNAGFFQTNEARTEWCIRRTCAASKSLSADRALELYRQNIQNATIPPEDLLVHLRLVAEYLGQTYQALSNTHIQPNMGRHYQNSSEDTIITHAIEYIHQNSTQHITMQQLTEFCHCSESYLSRLFKKHTGVNVNTYINKVRVEQAKNHLLLTDESVASLAISVGFNDSNYFCRVFTNIAGIPPTEFRRRFQEKPENAHPSPSGL